MHLYKTSGPVKAKPYLVKALKINPEHLNVRVGLSIALQEEGRLKEAKQLLIDFKGQSNVNYWKQFASISISFGEFEDAGEAEGAEQPQRGAAGTGPGAL